jgi:hypothetical protein
MRYFFEWLTINPIGATSIVIALSLLIVLVCLILLVAFRQGRSISFWPPKIGPKLDSKQIAVSSGKDQEDKKEREIEGLWDSSYSFFFEREVIAHNHLIELKKDGKYIFGKSLEESPSPHFFHMKGEIHYGSYFSGTWESSLKGNIYHGTFQFKIDQLGNSMKGKWLGSSAFKAINSGDWVIKKIKG